MRIKARRPPSPSFEISGTLLPTRMTTSANISPPSKNIGNTLTWWMTTTSRSWKSNSRSPSSLPYHCPGTISHGRILASKRVTTLILRSTPHPRSSSEYSRRRMYDNCNVLGKSKNKKWSTTRTLVNPSPTLPVTFRMPNAVASVTCEVTRPKIAGTLAKISVTSVKGLVTRPSTVTQGRQRTSSVSGCQKLIKVTQRRESCWRRNRGKRQMKGRSLIQITMNILSSLSKNPNFQNLCLTLLRKVKSLISIIHM